MQITPNRRLALFLQRRQEGPRVYTHSISSCDEAPAMMSSGAYELVCEQRIEPATKSQLERRRVYPLFGWVEELWELITTLSPKGEREFVTPELLTSYEEELIWEKIIANSEAGQNLIRTRPLANLAKDANELMQQWQLKSFAAFNETEESALFLQWWSEYQQELSRNHWLDTASLLEVITEHVPYLNRLPTKLECIGFSEWTPQQAKFLAALENRGTKLTFKNLNVTPKSVSRRVCSTVEEELYEAVLMSKFWLQEHSEAQIGLVILDLEQRREEVDHLFQRLLPEGSYNVAAPIAFSKQPIIAAALLGVSLTGYEIPLENISRFLRSPFFAGGIEEQSQRAAFDVLLHQIKQSHFTLRDLISILKTTLTIELPILLKIWETLEVLIPEISGKKNAVDWIELTKRCLTCLGWGQGRTLNQDETLVQAEWEPLLEMYQRAGKILGDHRYSEARFHIETLGSKKVYTPPVKAAQIHALGLLEAVGMPFDYLWCLGFTEKSWPKSPAPHPFIPLSLQCAMNLPRSTATRELQKAKEFTQALSSGAKQQVIFSHAKLTGDRPNKVSPLLKNLPLQSLSPSPCPLPKGERVQGSPSPFGERIQASPSSLGGDGRVRGKIPEEIVVPPKVPLKGSVRALSLQAQCPFKAFAEVRLNISPLHSPPRCLTKSERGELVHEILYLFWKETKSQENLFSLSETELHYRLKRCIDIVVSRFEKRFSKRATPNYMALERERLQDLILKFLTLEKTRPPFTVVALEWKTEHRIGPLAFSLRIDRIDKLGNGEELLIDYKTGQTQPSFWFETPPQAPQLPLYCISRNPTPTAVAFAVLLRNDLKYQGVAKEELSIQGIKPIEKQTPHSNWKTQCQHWQRDLEKLAQDFAEGIASVKPFQKNKPCRYCELQTLCRVSEI